MKILLSILFVTVMAIGTAEAQLASDSPAPLSPATSAVTNAPKGPVKLASEVGLSDTLKVKNTSKTPLQADKNQKLPSETEAPKRNLRVKN